MSRVTVSPTIANWDDVKRAEDGHLPPADVSRVEIMDALVGPVMTQIFEPIQLAIEGRNCLPEVAEVDDRCVVLLDHFLLKSLDFLVDTARHRHIGYSQHGNQMLQLF